MKWASTPRIYKTFIEIWQKCDNNAYIVIYIVLDTYATMPGGPSYIDISVVKGIFGFAKIFIKCDSNIDLNKIKTVICVLNMRNVKIC